MSGSKIRLSLFVCMLGIISLVVAGCGGGGGGGVPTAGIGSDQWLMTAKGIVDENPAAQGAPGRLEVPDRQEAPVIPGVGYVVKAVNGETGLTLSQTTSDSQGHFTLTFAIPKNLDMAIIFVAEKDTVTMRAILPVSAQELADLAAQFKFDIAMAVPISMITESKVQEVEALLGIASGKLGKVALPAEVTVAALCDTAESAGFVLQPEGVFTFTGDVDAGDVPAIVPTYTADAGADQYNKLFNMEVSLSGSAKAVTGSLAGRNLTYQWTQTGGPAVALSDANAAATSFTTKSLADTMTYAEGRLLADFPGTHERPDRFGLLSVDSHENAEFSYTFKLTITDVDSGNKAEDTVQVFSVARQPGLANVGKGLPVLLNAPAAESYDWAMSKPDGSNAALQDPAGKSPYFIPDASGTYEVTERISGKSMKIYAGTWTGVKASATGTDTSVNNGCGSCHKPTSFAQDLTGYFSEWGSTGHAGIFTHNVAPSDPASYHYGANCTNCHTVGRELAADNGGFDDLMAQKGYTIPATGDPNGWTNLVNSYPAVAALANIQCENCHGPSNSPGHGLGLAARVSMDVSVCGVCHGEPPRHNRNQIWAQSGHANPELAISRGTSGSCGRCHEAKGFVAWIPQVMAATNETQARASLPSSALATAETAQPIVCVACHDPHSATSPNQIRIYGDTPFLPAGFQATGAGKGALCMTCHNTRNGLRSDDAAPPNWGAPHTAAQADVLWGKNAYFVDPALPYKSVHASVADTCVTCHMDLVPANRYGGGTNHKFSVTPDQVCYQCHGEGATAAPLQAQVHEGLEELGDSIEAAAMAKIDDGVRTQIQIQAYPFNPDGTLYDSKSPATTIDVANIQSIEVMEPHGQQGFLFTFNAAVNFDYGGGTVVSATTAEVQTQNIKDTAGVVLFDPATDPIIKAGWDYFLFEGDGSFGVHNPKFVLDVLAASTAALQ